MRKIAAAALFGALAISTVRAEAPKSYVGVITDTMCGVNHAGMKISPETKCVRDCVGNGQTYRYAWTDGTVVYTLSDQETPAQFAGERVKVTGVLYRKTGILKVDRIERVR